jgi:membrane associated rhomboid family serine protease
VFRLWWNNPRTSLRITFGIIIAGGLIAGLGTLIRDLSSDQNDQWTFLLDTVGLVVAVVGAALDFRASARIAEFVPGAGKSRAILMILCGAIVAIGACVVLGWIEADALPPLVRGLLSAGMTAAIGAGLAGLLYIGWFSGADRVERRIEQRIDEDW